jgi:hypothetical protein
MVLTIWLPTAPFAGLGFFLLGAGPILWVISTTTLRQTVTPAELLGRVSVINIMAYGRLLARCLAAFLASRPVRWRPWLGSSSRPSSSPNRRWSPSPSIPAWRDLGRFLSFGLQPRTFSYGGRDRSKEKALEAAGAPRKLDLFATADFGTTFPGFLPIGHRARAR